MCDALMELMKDKLDEREQLGSQQQLLSLIQKKIQKGKSLSVIADELEETVDIIRPLYECVQTELITQKIFLNKFKI